MYCFLRNIKRLFVIINGLWREVHGEREQNENEGPERVSGRTWEEQVNGQRERRLGKEEPQKREIEHEVEKGWTSHVLKVT